MQLFMRGIPVHTRPEDLEIAIAKRIHRPPFQISPLINFHIRFFRHKQGQRFLNGILTLPDKVTGELFLSTFGGGIPIATSKVLFSRNKQASDEAQIARVASTVWRDPEVLNREAETRKANSADIPLTAFAFGRLCRDFTFSDEVRRDGNSTVSCDIENRRVRLTLKPQGDNLFDDLFDFALEPTIYAWYRASQVLALCSSTSDAPGAGHYSILLEGNAPPVFEKTPPLQIFDERPTSQRVESIFGNSPMPCVGRFLHLTFGTHDDLSLFVSRCKPLHIHHPIPSSIPIVKRGLYSKDVEVNCQKALNQLPFPLAFELDKAINGGILDPVEVLGLQGALHKLLREKGEEATAIFRWFTARIQAPSLKRLDKLALKDIQAEFEVVEKKRKNRRQRGRKRKNRPPPPSEETLVNPTLSDLLERAAKVYAPELPRASPLIAPTPAIYQSYHLIITPSCYISEGPLPDQSSSILRRFGNNDCFLRVTFQDDNRMTLRQDTTLNISIKELLASRYKRALVEGITVAGRHFEFLGYSMSGLKQHSVFFVHPFEFELTPGTQTLMTAEVIRSTLGDFSMIARKPALLAARWAQVFSASAPSVILGPQEIRRIEDRRSPSGSLFTDGCSPISPELGRAIWARLQGQRKAGGREKLIPSCYQIRVGGAKGVIFVDPTLTGRVLCLRKSQTKFETDSTLTLDIASTSARPIRMFLNRPLIMLLEHLGVKDKAFIDLQNDAIHSVDCTRSSFKDASKLFQQHGLGTSFRLPSLFNNLVRQLKLPDDAVSPFILQCDLITTTMAYAATHVLREIKFRGRIAVPGSFTLIGVSDEWGCLREGEIYATIRDERNGLYKQVEGKVLITRSPQIHPGDVQFVTAVRRPELSHLSNVVVFSCEGDRSLPSCLGGGDLDGDIYNLILDPDLFPTRTVKPGSYIGLPHKETADPCTVSDVADFVINYLEADLVGMISNRHLCIADQDPLGPECNDCLRLAEYASHAVDFPKTGTPVDFSQLPRGPTRLKPDFLSTEVTDASSPNSPFYPSKKILGRLYRRVPLQDDDPDYLDPTFGPVITDALLRFRTDRLDLPSIFEIEDDVLQEMDDLMEMYMTELQFIAKAHTLAKHPNEQLSEAELVSGTIQARWSDHHKRRDTVASMNLQTQQLTKAIRREFRRVEVTAASVPAEQGVEEEEDEDDEDDDEDQLSEGDLESFIRAAAAWQVAVEELEEPREAGVATFGATSFGLIALGVMLDVIKKARKLQ
ncbi:RdRP-domain-containing protein [Lyophyllum atratum]|nr:RdRP-domain-containing protein [Lyophyllum atratum]